VVGKGTGGGALALRAVSGEVHTNEEIFDAAVERGKKCAAGAPSFYETEGGCRLVFNGSANTVTCR